MSARIERVEKDGSRWVVSGVSQGDLETGIAALQKVLHKAEEPTERLERPRGRPPKNGVAREKARGLSRLQQAISVLRAISEASTKQGAVNAALTSAIGMEPGNKALGSVMGMVGRLLESMDIKPRTVYSTAGQGPTKRWFPKQNIGQAIKALEEQKELAET
jgi:hypothetical protein